MSATKVSFRWLMILSTTEKSVMKAMMRISYQPGHIRFSGLRLLRPAEQDAKPGCVQNTDRPHPAGKRNPPAHRRGADRERDFLEAGFMFKHRPRPQKKHHAQARHPQAGQPCPLRHYGRHRQTVTEFLAPWIGGTSMRRRATSRTTWCEADHKKPAPRPRPPLRGRDVCQAAGGAAWAEAPGSIPRPPPQSLTTRTETSRLISGD